jgi:predicted DNA-binding protein
MSGKDTKAMTLRLDPEQHAELEAIAQAEDIPVAQAVREAISAHIEAKRDDEEFRARLEERIERHRAILERLAE